MIDRYTREPMGRVWNQEARFENMMEVEIAVAHAQAKLGIIPKKAATDIAQKSQFDVERILEIESTTKHDVIAFVSNLAENVGESGRYIHYGMTSSDVLDTALSVQVGKAAQVLREGMDLLESEMVRLVKEHEGTLCAGRTHGMHAEPTTFGLKMAGYLAEFRRNKERFEKAVSGMLIGKLSGAVGTYSAQSREVEEAVCKKLKLKPETVATQVIPRDRHCELMVSLAMIGNGLERLSVELRHLQRSEVSEVIEGFSKGQKGSSAMPHKKNPISAENLTGVARLLRSYAQAAMEDVALWHERDISHSSVERVIFPDAFIICDYALHRMAKVLKGLYVDKQKMLDNMNLSKGQLYSSHVLLALVEKGLSREEAYAHVQRVSHSLKSKEDLKSALLRDKKLKALITKKRLDQIFSGQMHKKSISTIIKRALQGG